MAAILPSTPPPFVSKCNIQTLPNFLNQEANGDDPVPPRVVLADLTNRRTGPIRRIKQRSKSVITAEVRVKRVSDNPNVPTFHLHPQVHHPAANTATAAAAMHLVAYEVYSRYRIQKFKKLGEKSANQNHGDAYASSDTTIRIVAPEIGPERQPSIPTTDDEAARLADMVKGLDAETDRILAEQRKRDLARLHNQLTAALPPQRPAPSPSSVKPRSPVLKRFSFLTRVRWSHSSQATGSQNSSHTALSDLHLSTTSTSVGSISSQSSSPASVISLARQTRNQRTDQCLRCLPSLRSHQNSILSRTLSPLELCLANVFSLSCLKRVNVRFLQFSFSLGVTAATTAFDIVFESARVFTSLSIVSGSCVVLEHDEQTGLERRLRWYERIFSVPESPSRRIVKPRYAHCYAIKPLSTTMTPMTCDRHKPAHFFCSEDPALTARFFELVQGWRTWFLAYRQPGGARFRPRALDGDDLANFASPVSDSMIVAPEPRVSPELVDEPASAIAAFRQLLDDNFFSTPLGDLGMAFVHTDYPHMLRTDDTFVFQNMHSHAGDLEPADCKDSNTMGLQELPADRIQLTPAPNGTGDGGSAHALRSTVELADGETTVPSKVEAGPQDPQPPSTSQAHAITEASSWFPSATEHTALLQSRSLEAESPPRGLFPDAQLDQGRIRTGGDRRRRQLLSTLMLSQFPDPPRRRHHGAGLAAVPLNIADLIVAAPQPPSPFLQVPRRHDGPPAKNGRSPRGAAADGRSTPLPLPLPTGVLSRWREAQWTRDRTGSPPPRNSVRFARSME